MKSNISTVYRLLILFIFLVAATVTMSMSAFASDDDAVFHTTVIGSDGFSYTVDAHRDGNTHRLFLPSSTDTTSLELLYTGKGSVSYGGKKYSRGESMTIDASAGPVTIIGAGVQYKIEVMTGGRIPSVYIELDDGDDAFHAVCADKNHFEPGTLSMIGVDGSVIYSGGLEKFKGHGFTSFIPSGDTNYKNSYNIKLAEKSELIPGAGKIKKWVLLSPRLYDGSRDITGLSQLFAFNTYTGFIGDDLFGMKGEYVDLYVNNEYRGVYILCERMNDGGAIDVTDLDKVLTGEGDLKKVTDPSDPAIELGIRQYTYRTKTKLKTEDADITGGYVLEVMCETYDDCGFITDHGVYFTVKSPEFCSKEMVQYIASYVQSFENALFSETGYNKEGRHYSEYADMESLADMILVYAFFDNFEYFRTSTYIYKDADGKEHDKLTFGPVWDFETTANDLSNEKTFFGLSNWFTYFVNQQYIWSEQLWQHGDFMTVMYRENERMRASLDDVLMSVNTIIDDVSASQSMSTTRWNVDKYDKAAKSYVSAVKSRYGVWYDELWGDGYLLYLDVSTVINEDGTITMTADAGGTSDGKYVWYVLDPGNPSKYTLFSNSGETITVPSDGKQYFCKISGNNNAFCEFASGEIFSSRHISMYSAPVTADTEALTPPPETEADADTGIAEPETNGGCGSSIGTVYIAAALTPAAIILKKRKTNKNS